MWFINNTQTRTFIYSEDKSTGTQDPKGPVRPNTDNTTVCILIMDDGTTFRRTNPLLHTPMDSRWFNKVLTNLPFFFFFGYRGGC